MKSNRIVGIVGCVCVIAGSLLYVSVGLVIWKVRDYFTKPVPVTISGVFMLEPSTPYTLRPAVPIRKTRSCGSIQINGISPPLDSGTVGDSIVTENGEEFSLSVTLHLKNGEQVKSKCYLLSWAMLKVDFREELARKVEVTSIELTSTHRIEVGDVSWMDWYPH